MPKLAPNKLPSYRLNKARGLAVVTLNGKDIYLGPHGTAASKAKYDQVIAEWIANGRQLPDEAVSIAELVAAYLDFADGYYRSDGQSTGEVCNMEQSVRPLVRLYSREAARDFGPTKLKVVREEMIRDNISRRLINNRVNRIRRVFKWGIEHELVSAEVLHALQSVSPLKYGRTEARETEPVKPVMDEHVDAVLPHVNRQVAAMIQLQRLTGMRPGEVVIMRACDIDMTGKLWLYRPARHKTQHHGHQRVVEIGPRGQEIITPFLKRDTEAYLFSPIEADAERKAELRRRRKTKVQPSQRCRRKSNPKRRRAQYYTTNSYWQAVRCGCDKAEEAAREALGSPEDSERIVPRWHPHQLRHTFATRIRKEYGIETAKILLGHHSLDVTQMYAETDRCRAAEVALQVGYWGRTGPSGSTSPMTPQPKSLCT